MQKNNTHIHTFHLYKYVYVYVTWTLSSQVKFFVCLMYVYVDTQSKYIFVPINLYILI